MDIALGTDGDLDLTTGTVALLTGAAAVAQDLHGRLRTFLGEWFLDVQLGVPWWQRILGGKLDTGVIASLLRTEIAATPGLASIDTLTVTFDGTARALAVTFAGTTVGGDAVAGGVTVP